MFIGRFPLDQVRHQRIQGQDALKEEAKDEFQTDTRQSIRCPRCHTKMEKRPIASRYTTMTMDRCKECEGVWLDGGELAVAQLVYEASTVGKESLEFQKRMMELYKSPERKAQFDEAMASLPEDFPGDPVGDTQDILLTVIKNRTKYF